MLVVALLAVALPAQDPALEAFKDDIRAAVAAAEGGRPRDLRAARAHLDAAQARIDAIDDATKQSQARLFVAVRRADLLFRAPQPNTAKARELVEAGRTAARAASVWTGPYQETGLVLLGQAMPPVEFFALVESAPEDLALIEGRTEASADNAVPLRLLRADLRLFQGREREAVATWTELSTMLQGLDAGERRRLGDVWWDKCHGALVWHLLERREYARAEVYVPLLRDTIQRDYYAAVLANQRGDFIATEGLLANTADPRALLVLADAQEQLGKFADAIANYEAAAGKPGIDDELRAAAQNGLGDCYRRRDEEGDRDRAQACYEHSLRALVGLSSRKVDSEIAGNYRDLGALAELRGAQSDAFAWFERALATLENARAGIPLDPFGAAFLEPQLLGAVDGVLRTWHAAGATPLAVLAAVDRAKARSLLDRVATPRALEQSPEVLAAVRELALARDADNVQRARLQLERARAAVGERTRLVRPEPLDAARLHALLEAEPDVVTFAYWLGEQQAWLVVARGSEVRVCELGSAVEVKARLRAAYEVVSQAPTDTDPWVVLDAAAHVFVPAAARALLPGAHRVVFAPDDRLARLPFEALRCQGTAMGLGFEVERAPSLAVRAELRARRAKPATGKPTTLIVDSVPLAPAIAKDFGLDDLRFSQREGDLVAQAWPHAARLRAAAATLAGVRAQLERQPTVVLHISSHAVTHGVVPSASLLLLADGAVPLSSFGELRLDGATVVLSACSTATGEVRGGEGDAGLLWGPLGAGARSVVASVWAVNQQATCDLMGQMHYWLARDEDVVVALQRSRQALAASDNYAHPHYWAGFAAFGGGAARGGHGVATQTVWVTTGLGFAVLFGALWLWRVRAHDRRRA